MGSSTIIPRTEDIIAMLNKLKLEVRKYEEDEAYKEYCEGLIHGAIACLKVMIGDVRL
jgi:hypothetical protein